MFSFVLSKSCLITSNRPEQSVVLTQAGVWQVADSKPAQSAIIIVSSLF